MSRAEQSGAIHVKVMYVQQCICASRCTIAFLIPTGIQSLSQAQAQSKPLISAVEIEFRRNDANGGGTQNDIDESVSITTKLHAIPYSGEKR